MAETRAHVEQLVRALELARGPELHSWSLRTAERALAWAACVEAHVRNEGLKHVQDALKGVDSVKRKRGEIPLRGLTWSSGAGAGSWLSKARMTLVLAMAESPHLTPKLKTWVEQAAESLGSGAPEFVQDAFERVRKAKEQLDKIPSVQEADERIRGALLIQEAANGEEFRKAVEEGLQDAEKRKEAVTCLVLAAREALLKAEGNGIELPMDMSAHLLISNLRPSPWLKSSSSSTSNAGNEENLKSAGEWAIRTLHEVEGRELVALERRITLDIARRDFLIATKLLSGLLEGALAAHSILGNYEGADGFGSKHMLLPPLKEFCSKAPWMRLLCLDALEAATIPIARKLWNDLK
mmetsp:Transcript_2743/g.6407  ORF Transcript_2743/g.6407 Transcript_2743/m.6407 type:complete len:353 (+) Transcript_2743:109-1167(+)